MPALAPVVAERPSFAPGRVAKGQLVTQRARREALEAKAMGYTASMY